MKKYLIYTIDIKDGEDGSIENKIVPYIEINNVNEIDDFMKKYFLGPIRWKNTYSILKCEEIENSNVWLQKVYTSSEFIFLNKVADYAAEELMEHNLDSYYNM